MAKEIARADPVHRKVDMDKVAEPDARELFCAMLRATRHAVWHDNPEPNPSGHLPLSPLRANKKRQY